MTNKAWFQGFINVTKYFWWIAVNETPTITCATYRLMTNGMRPKIAMGIVYAMAINAASNEEPQVETSLNSWRNIKSTRLMSWLNLANTRPLGVVSKKLIGALRIRQMRAECKLRQALTQQIAEVMLWVPTNTAEINKMSTSWWHLVFFTLLDQNGYTYTLPFQMKCYTKGNVQGAAEMFEWQILRLHHNAFFGINSMISMIHARWYSVN